MNTWPLARLKRAISRCLRRPWLTLAWALAVVCGLYVIAGPLLSTRYPMMTDLPFHAASASVFAHYGEPAYHFREQFELQPLAVPYLTHYLLAALFMQVTGAVTAIKLATAVLLSLLPLGLGVLMYGMRKSPLLGLAGLLLVWCPLTHWGFINFVAALGLFAMALGAALRVLDKPSRGWRVALGGVLLLLLVTHPFRFPFAVLAIGGAALVMAPAQRRWRPLLLPVALPSGVFALWWAFKPASFEADWGSMTPQPERLSQLRGYLYGSFHDAAEVPSFERAVMLLSLLALVCALLAWRGRRGTRPLWRRFSLLAHVLVAGCVAGFLLAYLMLPMEVASWWYIYPREATACVFVALGLLPDLPRRWGGHSKAGRGWAAGRGWGVLAMVVVMVVAVAPLGSIAIRNHRHFDRATADFHKISQQLPDAPKLAYLIFDHAGSRARTTPFIHLPAYIQAERGGWLSFHFASMQGTPVRYRRPPAPVPPATPRRWEWTPNRFRMRQHGRFFDWFLIREGRDPSHRLRGDGPIELVAHEGSWWLFRRADRTRPKPAR